ncbi:DUF4136 domain-containing protein [Algoriphagus kandeliae]|uniref:DUF4136 domain-containing protein n=1 Tax=Algoriphagus kandeliae TaxID=2562278 RepID=A0A4Y9R0X2_9BACT|nr:DUF4136 domain-containing protein [Algoriphagus kandeliae]TFV97512.1 DUF4136 domain-containing protein [Algoriphagus kandeliae]
MKYLKNNHLYKTLFATVFTFLLAIPLTLAQKTYTDIRETEYLSDYQTYDWVLAKDVMLEDIWMSGDMVFVFNNETSNAQVKEAIDMQMSARGFSHDEENPDMLVNFQILEKPTELRTYTMTNGQDYLGFGPRSMSTKMVPVKAGTVIVNFIDAESGNQIWQGFASGAFSVSDLKDINNLEAKVISIFNDWDFDPFGEE